MSTTQKQKIAKSIVRNIELSYNELTIYLDSLKPIEYCMRSVSRVKQIDKALENISNDINIISVAGTNGKSSTVNLTGKLLSEEGYRVGTFYSSHAFNYTERISLNNFDIQQKAFIKAVNEIIYVTKTQKINATSHEIMTMSAILYFKEENVDVAILEVGLGGKLDATAAFNPKIVGITRIAESETDFLGKDLEKITNETVALAKENSWLVSAEQSKIRLKKMKELAEKNKINWSMPVRKLAPIPYIYEQLYGRSASLGERLAQLYSEKIKEKFSSFLRGNMLELQKGQRGRPTLEEKKSAAENPIKSLQKFWNEKFDLMPGRFELLKKESPTVLLDIADNLDAFKNLFLGIRLLHYQKSIKGLSLIMSLKNWVTVDECLKLIRYMLKKMNGQIIFVNPSKDYNKFLNPKELEEKARKLGLKSKSCKKLEEAIDFSKKISDDREGLVTITGSLELISDYWRMRGVIKN